MRRPNDLAEVVARVADGSPFDYTLADFLDEFYLDDRNRQARLSSEPQMLPDAFANAYVAAVAEHLSLRYSLEAPEWVRKPDRFLHRPWFAGGLESLKAALLVESPTAFRRRMLFVSANALNRASMYAGKAG